MIMLRNKKNRTIQKLSTKLSTLSTPRIKPISTISTKKIKQSNSNKGKENRVEKKGVDMWINKIG